MAHLGKMVAAFLVTSLIWIIPTTVRLRESGQSNSVPEWYRLSNVVLNMLKAGTSEAIVFLGNSFTYTGINPKAFPSSEHLYNFSRGGTPSVEVLLWLNRKQIYPKMIVLEVNGFSLKSTYAAAFDLVQPNGIEPFDQFKYKLEIETRLFFEKNLNFLTLSLTPNQILSEFYSSHFNPVETFNRLLPLNINREENVTFHDNGFVEDNRNLDSEEIERKTRNHLETYRSSIGAGKQHVSRNLELADRLTQIFLKKGVKVVFIRLPRDKRIEAMENSELPDLFSGYKNLSGKLNIPYIEIGNDLNEQTKLDLFSDGAHFTNTGANIVSTRISKQIGI